MLNWKKIREVVLQTNNLKPFKMWILICRKNTCPASS